MSGSSRRITWHTFICSFVFIYHCRTRTICNNHDSYFLLIQINVKGKCIEKEKEEEEEKKKNGIRNQIRRAFNITTVSKA